MVTEKVQTAREVLEEGREILVEGARKRYIRGLLDKAAQNKKGLSFRQVQSLSDAFSRGYSEALDMWIENAP